MLNFKFSNSLSGSVLKIFNRANDAPLPPEIAKLLASVSWNGNASLFVEVD